ncbi:YybH family protein [Paenibacillus tyrfis]|uniref:YybH family protein n=1 Tax=Paenibacillus tyrfis TaxID=1501230 RepID=UPI00209D0118|nr:DUF4440 domain-containing protein [Paenibacillus tyrfis]MCP1312394.1 DUF4440 domain-containing protein [Paenibacillus tyrfis]
MEDIRKIINSNNERFAEAVLQKNAAGITALYTKQALLIPSDSANIQGFDQIQLFWDKMLKDGLSNLVLESVEIELGGEHQARENGLAHLTLINHEEKVQYVSSKYMVLWRFEDGSWKIDIDIMF